MYNSNKLLNAFVLEIVKNICSDTFLKHTNSAMAPSFGDICETDIVTTVDLTFLSLPKLKSANNFHIAFARVSVSVSVCLSECPKHKHTEK